MATTTASTIAATCLLIISFTVVSSLYITNLSSSNFDCTVQYGCFYLRNQAASHHGNHPLPTSRKILMGLGVPKGKAADSSERPNIKDGVELRNVPSGPDPLHHNGGPQRRPKISP